LAAATVFFFADGALVAAAVVLSERVALADGFFAAVARGAVLAAVAGPAAVVFGAETEVAPEAVAAVFAPVACAVAVGTGDFTGVAVAFAAAVVCAVVAGVCGLAVCERPGAAEAASSARLSVHARGIASRLEIGRPLMSPPPLRLRREGGSGR